MTISTKQASFIRSLLDDRNPDVGLRVEAQECLATGERRQASGIIERLLNAPRISAERANLQREPSRERIEVAAGRYALPSDFDPEGTPVFYRVDEGSGKWEGYTFLSRLVGPNEDRLKDRAERERILRLIAENPTDALRRYGNLSGHCGNCGVELTDKFSRFIGVGPVCREKLGLDKSEAAYVRKGGILPDEYVREVLAEEAEANEDARIRANEARDEDYVFGDASGEQPLAIGAALFDREVGDAA